MIVKVLEKIKDFFRDEIVYTVKRKQEAGQMEKELKVEDKSEEQKAQFKNVEGPIFYRPS